MATYSLDQLFGYSAYANKPTGKHTSPTLPAYKTAQKGEFLGIIYSYVVRDGIIWLQLDNHGDGQYKTCFVKWPDVDSNKLKGQGVKSDAQLEKEKDERDMPWYERLISKYGTSLMLGLALITAIPAIFGYMSKKRK